MQKLTAVILLSFLSLGLAFTGRLAARTSSHRRALLNMQADGLKIDMRGKTVFVGGVADSTGYGWAIAKACAEAGAKVINTESLTSTGGKARQTAT